MGSNCTFSRKGTQIEPRGFNLGPFWRRGWDSNPRGLAPKLISSQPRYDRFDTSPYEIAGMRERKDAKSNRPSGNIVAMRAHRRCASLFLISVTRFAKTIHRIVFARLPVIPASIPLRMIAGMERRIEGREAPPFRKHSRNARASQMPFIASCFRYALRENDTPYRFRSLTRDFRFDTAPCCLHFCANASIIA